jgi:nucleoside-diphosphate kinase
MEQTLVLLKPDAVKRGIAGEIIHRFERMGLKIVAIKMVKANKALLDKHYATDKTSTVERIGGKTIDTYKKYNKDVKKEFGTDDPARVGKVVVGWLLDFMSENPVIAMVIEGKHAVDNVVTLAGSTMPVNAPAGTIRGDFSTDSAAYANEEKRAVTNLVHISATPEEAKFEISLWFTPEEIYSY